MQKGNQAPLALGSATTSSLPTTSLDFCLTDNFTLFSFERKQLGESELKHFPAELTCLCLISLKDRSKSSLQKAYAEHQYNMFWWVQRSDTTCRGLSLKAVLSTGP